MFVNKQDMCFLRNPFYLVASLSLRGGAYFVITLPKAKFQWQWVHPKMGQKVFLDQIMKKLMTKSSFFSELLYV